MSAPMRRAISRLLAIGSETSILQAPALAATASVSSPMVPAPEIARVCPLAIPARSKAWTAIESGSTSAASSKLTSSGM